MLAPFRDLEQWKRESVYTQLAEIPWHVWLKTAGVYALLAIPALRRPLLSWMVFPDQDAKP